MRSGSPGPAPMRMTRPVTSRPPRARPSRSALGPQGRARARSRGTPRPDRARTRSGGAPRRPPAPRGHRADPWARERSPPHPWRRPRGALRPFPHGWGVRRSRRIAGRRAPAGRDSRTASAGHRVVMRPEGWRRSGFALGALVVLEVLRVADPHRALGVVLALEVLLGAVEVP